MKLRIAGRSDIGRKRKINEDNYLIKPDLGLYVIADGMGGHKAGEVASLMVVESMEEYWRRVNINDDPSLPKGMKQDVSYKAKHLINSIYFTNTLIHEAQKQPEYLRMGSTVSALLVEGDVVWLANVGDSPIYLLDRGRLRLVSEEHSVEAEQKNLGIYDSFNSTNPLMKNMLTRVMGLHEKVDVYIIPMRPEPGDIILMCSDGLTNFMSGQSITETLSDASRSLEDKVNLLIDGANEGGGGDNITVILLELLEEGKWERFKKRLK